MDSTADKITRIILEDVGHADAMPMIDAALNGPGEPRRIAQDTLRGLGVSRIELAMIELAHASDRRDTSESETRNIAIELRRDFDEAMSGKGPPCRHIELMKTTFWRTISLTAIIPLVVFVGGSVIIWLITKK